MKEDVLDAALDRFGSTGPEFAGGLSNHGPMAAEALVRLGRADAVESWVSWYAPRLSERPSSRNPIDPQAWQSALGDIGRVGDWESFFRRELHQQPWRSALEAWTARLAPGVMAAATHGIIRSAHAVRALEHGETEQRVAELGEALAYWAARYQDLPTAPWAAGALRTHEALSAVPQVDQSQRRAGLIFEAVKRIDADAFAPVINAVNAEGDAAAFLSDITRTFVRYYLSNASHAAIALIHSVTAPAAVRLLAPYLSDDTRTLALRYTWQACAAIYAAYVRAPAREDSGAEGAVVDAQDLIEQAVAARDEHAIKFTEACLREHSLSGDAAFLAAAQDVVTRLRAR